MTRSARFYPIILLAVALASDSGFGKDADAERGDEETPAPSTPRLYVDVSTTYTAIPANSFAIGFRNSFSLANLNSLSAQSVAFSLPVTVDVSDRLSIYAGVNTYASRSEGYGWTSMVVDSWSAGFQAVAYEQKGGLFPSVTVQSTYTQSISGVISARGTASIVEFGYALNEDETKGLLAGVKYANIMIDSAVLNVGSSTIGYLGAYYQWPDNWKLTGRAGVQAFDGANLGSLLQVKPFTLPILRLDLDRMTDDDRVRFGLTAELAWAPKPTFQLTLRTPITLR
ncbi:hypothetical protein [Tardiphaga sp.]|uniref:hypothetical protein n=1 Tax=Tardiphaga sp. TaxID=1926292 RepID=UPI0026222D32|nr:hypothetical protein [Tardiphaga sp.]MDB5617244.1 hypothetical protein [Tardiphaga sp.]